MSKIRTATGVMKTLFYMTREDWKEMDKKFYRLVFGAASFVAMALFYLYFLKSVLHI